MRFKVEKPYKIFSKTITNDRIAFKFCGLTISFRVSSNLIKMLDNKKAVKIQNKYDLSHIKNAKKIIVFLSPFGIGGGIMSFFSLCETSRRLNNNVPCIISSYPKAKRIYAYNDKFLNNEKIYRFEQIVDNAINLDEMILHIPEYYAKDFYKDLTQKDIKFLLSIEKLHINIMNQNIELMPESQELYDLYKLSKNITQTIAHDRYATQKVCDKWQIPTHLFSTYVDLSKYKSYIFEEKEKIIAISPDENKHKNKILKKLKENLVDWQIITISNMTFGEFMDLISRAYFTITFGEGMDGYFSQPHYVNSIGFAVYNDTFFPNKEWKKLKNIYSSYDDMYHNIIIDIQNYANNKQKYEQIIQDFMDMITKIYQKSKFEDNLKRFYKGDYDFLPKAVI